MANLANGGFIDLKKQIEEIFDGLGRSAGASSLHDCGKPDSGSHRTPAWERPAW